jgi:hypothetical protein
MDQQVGDARFVPKADIGLGLHDGQKCHPIRLTERADNDPSSSSEVVFLPDKT